MKLQKLILLAVVIPLLSFTTVHKFYVSVTNIEHNKKEKSVQIITRIFIDDLEDILQERYDIKEELTTEKSEASVEALMTKYLKKKLKISINGEAKTWNFIGKEYEDDMVICYLEIPMIETVSKLEVENSILCDLVEEQQNLVHVKVNNQRKTLLLVKENDKGLLKF